MKVNKIGVTLVEVMIVVAIIGLAAAIIIPAAVKKNMQLNGSVVVEKLTPQQQMDDKLNLVQNYGHGAFYFPFAEMSEYLSVRAAFMDKNPSLEFVSSEPDVVRQNKFGNNYGDYGATVGHAVFFK